MRCRCPDCDSNPLPTYLPEHRLACEINYVSAMTSDRRQRFLKEARKKRGAAAIRELEVGYLLRLPDRRRRRAYLEEVERFRGSPERQALADAFLAVWQEARSPGAA